MERNLRDIQKMREDQKEQKIKNIQQKIDTTQYNIEVSKEIIAETPSDTQEEKLKEKNTGRRHAVASLRKKIRDIQETL